MVSGSTKFRAKVQKLLILAKSGTGFLLLFELTGLFGRIFLQF